MTSTATTRSAGGTPPGRSSGTGAAARTVPGVSTGTLTGPSPLLRVASTAPALAVALWLGLMWPLPEWGLAGPVLGLLAALVAVTATVAVVRAALRLVPAGRAAQDGHRTPSWVVPALLAESAAFGVLAAAVHAEPVLLRRDPGVYALAGQWLGTTGQLLVEQVAAGATSLPETVNGESPGFFAEGHDLVPQFFVGVHLVHAAGWWLAGWGGLLVVPAVAGALGLLAVGGLVARLVGPRWSVLAVPLLGASYPVLSTSRSTYSEPLAMLLLVGALCLLVDVLASRPEAAGGWRRRGPARDRWLVALAAGALLGLGTLVRVDVLREVALVCPVLVLLAVRRDPVVVPLAVGLAGGTATGTAAAFLHSVPYLDVNAASVVPLALAAVAVASGCAVAALWLRGRADAVSRRLAPGGWPPRWLPTAGAAAVALVLLGMASRPLWLTVRQDPTSPGGWAVAGHQERLGLPVDGSRAYSENSVEWLAWWLGWPAVAAAGVAAALLARALLAGRREEWWAPLLVVLGTTVLTLWRPAITPDHPWADRRFVPVVLPGLVLLATWALARLVEEVRRRSAARAGVAAWAGPAVAAAGVLALGVPVALASAPMAFSGTERLGLDAARAACAQVGEGDAVVLVDGRAAREWPQVLRGECGAVALTLNEPTQRSLEQTAQALREVGLTPYAAYADDPRSAEWLGLDLPGAREVVRLRSSEEQRTLVERPDGRAPLYLQLWLAPLEEGPS